jgi:release factor glutamine methyltransferase
MPNAAPSAYADGSVEFFYRRFKTDRRALVPRLETESLVREAIRYARIEGYRTLVDVGTGSGIIAVSVGLSVPFDRVVALDVSPEALSLARENALANGLEAEFYESDLLSVFSDGGDRVERLPQDAANYGFANVLALSGLRIVCRTHSSNGVRGPERKPIPSILFLANLPYVREGDQEVSPDTAAEPPEALYGGPETGFETTRRFLEQFEALAAEYPQGRFRVMCEVGHDHAEEIAKAAADLNRDIETFPDLRGIHRFFTYRIWPKKT